MSPYNCDFFSWVIRLMGVHFFRLRLFTRIARCGITSPKPAGGFVSATRGPVIVHVHVHGAHVAYTRRREARGQTVDDHSQ